MWVILEGAPPRPGGAPPRPDDAPPGDQAELVAALREALEVEREANRENRRIIAALTQRIPPALEPPGEPETDAGDLSSTRTPPDRETGGERRRSWWREFFGFD